MITCTSNSYHSDYVRGMRDHLFSQRPGFPDPSLTVSQTRSNLPKHNFNTLFVDQPQMLDYHKPVLSNVASGNQDVSTESVRFAELNSSEDTVATNITGDTVTAADVSIELSHDTDVLPTVVAPRVNPSRPVTRGVASYQHAEWVTML